MSDEKKEFNEEDIPVQSLGEMMAFFGGDDDEPSPAEDNGEKEPSESAKPVKPAQTAKPVKPAKPVTVKKVEGSPDMPPPPKKPERPVPANKPEGSPDLPPPPKKPERPVTANKPEGSPDMPPPPKKPERPVTANKPEGSPDLPPPPKKPERPVAANKPEGSPDMPPPPKKPERPVPMNKPEGSPDMPPPPKKPERPVTANKPEGSPDLPPPPKKPERPVSANKPESAPDMSAEEEARKKAAAEALRRRESAEDSFSASAGPSGPPISSEEAARRAEAESALDRDLAKARKKKLQEERYYRQKFDDEKKLEKERMAKAEEAKERLITAAETAKRNEEKRAARAAEEEAKITPEQRAEAEKKAAKRKKAIETYTTRSLMEARSLKAGAVLGVLLIVMFCAAYVYVGSENEKFYATIDPKINVKTIVKESDSYSVPSASPINEEKKNSLGLCLWLPDSDMDGLSDSYELDVSKTDPSDSDCDKDGVTDGRELRAELDPMNPSTDGSTPDAEVIRDVKLYENGVTAEISGIPRSAYVSLARSTNNSIQGTPGLVSSAFELYSDKVFDKCSLIFRYYPEYLGELGMTESELKIYRFDPEELTFRSMPSAVNTNDRTVSTEVTGNGIYALCSSKIVADSGKTNIFFLIDNSGSMYPEDMCAGSEENDVEFKRLDFALNLMDKVGKSARYGAGEFSGDYAEIIPITDDMSAVKEKINEIRGKEQVFSGTEIAGAIIGAASAFGEAKQGDRNFLILLTDGMPSVYNGAADRQAIELAKDKNITIFTIGLGKQIDTEYLFSIAEQTNGQFFQASNADALENIYFKIQSFMSYNRVYIDEESNWTGYLIADSGFNVLKDGIGYSNFRADFALDGADAGIAGLIKAYYTGELNTEEGYYNTSDGKTVDGYDISDVKDLSEKKVDLSAVNVDILHSYMAYTALPEKWNYKKLRNSVLMYNDATRDFIDSHSLSVVYADYDFEPPEPDTVLDFLRILTFQRIKSFSSYERVIIDSSVCTGNDRAVMNMIKWFNYLPQSDKCHTYDFGYNGGEAFSELVSELNTGCPSVLICGGKAMNAVRLVRDTYEPDLFVIDAYDCNSPERITRIKLTRYPIYDKTGSTEYQYSAKLGSEDIPLQLISTK